MGTAYNPNDKESSGFVSGIMSGVENITKRIIYQYKNTLASSDAGRGALDIGFEAKFLSDIARSLTDGGVTKSIGYDTLRRNIARAAEGTVVSGSSLTGVYESMRNTQTEMFYSVVNEDIKLRGENIRLLRNLAHVDFSNPDSVKAHFETVEKLASDVFVKDEHLENLKGYKAGDVYESDQEIAILLAIKNASELGKQTANYTAMMQNYIDKQVNVLKPTVETVLSNNGTRFGDKVNLKSLNSIIGAHEDANNAAIRSSAILKQLAADGIKSPSGVDFSALSQKQVEHIVLHDLATYTKEQRKRITDLAEQQRIVAQAPVLSSADLASLRKMKDMIEGKADFSDKYLFGRIATGEIDVDKIIKSGTFCGATLTPEMKDTLITMRAFACAGQTNTNAHNDLMVAIGGDASRYKSVNLNTIKAGAGMQRRGECGISERIGEFKKAFDKAGIVAPNGRKISSLDLKQLRKLVNSDAFLKYTAAQQAAIIEYLKLKELMESLKGWARLIRRLGFLIIDKMRRGIRNTDADKGLRKLHRLRQIARMSYITALKTGRVFFRVSRFFYMHSPAKFRVLMGKAAAPVQKAISSIRKVLASVCRGARNAAAKASAAAKRAAKKAQKKVSSFVKNKAPKTTKNVKKVYNNVKKKIDKKLKKRAARRAQRKALAQAGKGGKLLRFFKKVSEKLGKAMMALLKYLAIALIVAIVITAIGCLIETFSENITQLNDTLFGWWDTEKWEWSDKPTDEDKKNILYATLYTLQDEEDYILKLKSGEGVGNVYSFADPNNDFKSTIFEVDENGEIDGKIMYYFYENEDGSVDKIPITQYSNTKFAIGAAHAVTCPIEDKDDLDAFTQYALGTWRYLNQTDVKVFMDICDGDGKYYYTCNSNDKIYNYVVKTYHPGDEIPISKVSENSSTINGHSLALVDDVLVSKTEKGCRVTYYTNGTFKTYDLNDDYAVVTQGMEGILTGFKNVLSPTSAINFLPENLTENNPFAKIIPNSTSYYAINPMFNSMCTEEIQPLDNMTYAEVRQFIADNVTFHTEGNMSKCINCSTIFCEGCVVKTNYHQDLTAPCTCEGCITTPHYKCLGHEGRVYDSTVTARDKYNSLRSHVITSPCSNCVSFVTKTGETGYECLGHQGTVYCSVGESSEPCMNCEVTYTYTCPGYETTECPGHEVCLGHYNCQGHYFCPGHEATYCTGHIKYVVTEYIRNLTKNPDMLFDQWEYEVHNKYWIFNSIDRYTSDEIQKKAGFSGWDENSKSAAYGIANQDWYKRYGLSSAQFQGGQCSSSEIQALKYKYNIDDSTTNALRMRVIDTAFDSVGKVPYYPGGQAYGATYETTFGLAVEPREGTNGVVYSNFGLDGKYYADWIFWSSNYNPKDEVPVYKRNKLLKEMDVSRLSLSKATEENLLPGDILVKLNSNKTSAVTTCIFLGYDTVTTEDGTIVGLRVISMGSDWAKIDILRLGSDWNKVDGIFD